MSLCWQGDPRWRELTLGFGPTTIGRSGCLLTCFVHAARDLCGMSMITPQSMNDKLKAAGAFTRDGIIIPLAAEAIGLVSPVSERVSAPAGDPKLKECLDKALQTGYALLKIDHGVDGTHRFHHLLAVGHNEDGSVKCADSALGQYIPLDPVHLDAHVLWLKTPQTYQVVSVSPLRQLPH